ncbi:MAG: stage II sporulation protein M [Candidatus Korarchaeota archaeon]|nr:stage II sporulation protein M [Candidatus Korarchaeota archaeon]
MYGIRPSKLSTRVLAHLIDLSIILAAYAPFILIFSPQMEGLGLLGLSLSFSLLVLLIVLYFTLSEGYTSATIGKKLFGLSVISLSTISGVSMGEAFIRNLMRLSDIATLYLVTLISKGNRRIGDIAANTLVVSRDLLRLEVPLGDSEIAKDMRKGIIDALISKLSDMDREKLLPLSSAKGVTRIYSKLMEEMSDGVSEEMKHTVAILLSDPRFARSFLSVDEITKVYEIASKLCYHIESRDILRRRVELMRAVLRADRRPEGLSLAKGVRSMFLRAPAEFRGILPYFLTSLILFLVSLIGAYIWRPQWLGILLKEIFGKDVIPPSIDPATLSALIFMNNVRVVLVVVGMAPLIFTPILILIANGALVGLVLGISERGLLQTLAYIVPHGVPELTAIFSASSIALLLIKEIIHPSGMDRAESLSRALKERLDLMALVVILLIYAATVEGFLTRQLGQDPQQSLIFSIVEGIVLYLYLLLAGRTSTSSPDSSEGQIW